MFSQHERLTLDINEWYLVDVASEETTIKAVLARKHHFKSRENVDLLRSSSLILNSRPVCKLCLEDRFGLEWQYLKFSQREG